MRAMTRRLTRRTITLAATLVGLATLTAACGGGDDASDDTSASASESASESAPEGTSESAAAGASDAAAAGECSPDSLETLEAGVLTVGTGEPAFEPWVVGDAPESGEGFEAAVAYAVAEQLGYAEDQVTWVRTTFDAAIQPGPKTFDFNLQQYSITDERKNAVDFSSPYYEARQAVITVEGSNAADAASLADFAGLNVGAAVGTTSFAAIEEFMPDANAQVFNNNDDAKLALSNGQVDALVLDLPTALFVTAVELEGGTVLGQLPQIEGETEQFGLVLDKDSPLTSCVSGAVDALREDGTLADLESQWLTDVAGAPELS